MTPQLYNFKGCQTMWNSFATHVDALVGAAGGEALVRLPVDVEGGRGVEGKLLLVLARQRVPDDGGAVDACQPSKVRVSQV